MNANSEYEIVKEMVNKITSSAKKPRKVITEEKEDKSNDAIAITNDPKFGNNVLQNQIDAFRHAVNGGAKFSSENGGDAEENPLIYYPSDGNVVFSGSIPSMSGLKFQFSVNDVTASPYIFVDGLALTEDVITTLNKLRGYYLNFRDEWMASGDLLDKLKKDE